MDSLTTFLKSGANIRKFMDKCLEVWIFLHIFAIESTTFLKHVSL